MALSGGKKVSVAPRLLRMTRNICVVTVRLRRSKAVCLAETLAEGRCAGHLLASVVTPTDPDGVLSGSERGICSLLSYLESMAVLGIGWDYGLGIL